MNNPVLPQVTSATPSLSIIVATKNASATLKDCLDSIFCQMFSDWELIIVDGGSTDSTISLIQSYDSRIAYWRSKPDAGIYDAWNHALEHAQGKYVCFLGADDKFHSDSVLDAVFAAISNKEYDLVTSKGLLSSNERPVTAVIGSAWNYRKVSKRITICHPGALHLRSLFDRHGLFDASYRISGDYEFLLRLPPSLRTLHLDIVSVDIGQGGISRENRWLMMRERFRIQAGNDRVGTVLAAVYFVDKLWRIPVARLLGMQN